MNPKNPQAAGEGLRDAMKQLASEAYRAGKLGHFFPTGENIDKALAAVPAIAPGGDCPFYSGGECTCGNDQHPWIGRSSPTLPAAGHAAPPADPPAAGGVKRWRPGTHIEPGRTQVYGRMEESDNGGFVWFDDYDQLRQQLAAALAERDRAVKDAARYRWLRDGGTEELCARARGDNPIHPHLWAHWPIAAEHLDTAIDAAIAAGGEWESE